jgi:hypothetical protein
VAARSKKQEPQVPQSKPQRVEIRVDGRVRFSDECWDVELSQENSLLKLNAALHPTLMSFKANPPERFGDDPRDGEEVIQKVHSGRRAPAKEQEDE